MSPLASHLLHQAFFGGIAAAGFGVLFNCPPRFLWLCFASGALALAVRTGGQEIGGFDLPAASFIAAFLLAVLNRMLEEPDSPRGSVLAVVGCIPMIPGSLAAKGLMNLFELLRTTPGEGLLSTTAAVENLMLVAFTLVGIGTALAIPTLVFPVKRSDD
jgi:uncharacterized membrane protein YjjB (DUF3815 family)